ncbi:MAG: 16S rRNA (uracil(1498)-N(3))-methyltransferase [Betaproteobacteria bacterium]
MAEPRFFIETDLAVGAIAELPASVAHHASHVLRLRDGDPVVLFNGRGGEFAGRLAARGTQVQLAGHAAVEREAPVAVTLVQAWIATDKLDWVIEKATELGVARLVMAPTRRSVVRLEAARVARRVERLREIAVAACCQCGRNRVPSIAAFGDLASALADGGAGATGFALQPDAPRSLVDVAAATPGPIAIAVGPEGGFDEDEFALVRRAGFQLTRLGPRVLRTETAGLAALAALQGTIGDFA